MRVPGPNRRCRRCTKRRVEHGNGKCDDGRDFKSSGKRHAASQSFLEGECKLLDQLLKNAMAGKPSGYLTQKPSFTGLARKTLAMLKRCEMNADVLTTFKEKT